MNDSSFKAFKIKIAIALSLVLFLIFAKSLVDKSNVDELEASFVSVYEDRLVVQDYIFNITELLFRMRLLVADTESLEQYLSVKKQVMDYHDQILNIISSFEETHLTPKESEYLKEFKSLITEKLEIESYFTDLEESEQNYQTTVEKFNTDFERVFYDLRELSKIQLREGEKLTNLSYRIKARSDIWMQFEYAVLFVLLIIISMLIYSSRAIRKKEETA
ncbi:Four helix bundle sensory module for signal transduction [Cyclobacterium xiamenense]|uniref:Four helix bundle sensory module for signal transduction n=1 Tax=Cyclobacterium xiamenense TaxID=1297121 RepID=A0A1H6ZWC7_9BACT|nr:MCP four helix bundle domain-containing protein [Cyclobacterium xiamenense]SEJ56956.1 Four helix bundle sensory module for signal transduction [Cyclobacterium xiamenense]